MAKKTKRRRVRLWITFLAALLLLAYKTFPNFDERPSPKLADRLETSESYKPSDRSIPISNIHDFDEAKKELRRLFSRGRDFYCSCSYDFTRKPHVDPSSCGLRSKADRAKRIEWEHVVPASFYGRQFASWKKGDETCRGKEKKGRECARKVSAEFRRIEGDMYNLVPAVGELNRVRGDNIFGLIPGEPREFGACDFETLANTTEPKSDIRGDIARIYFYMDARYPDFGIVNHANESMFVQWSNDDPMDEKERERVLKIEAVQGNSFFIGRLATKTAEEAKTSQASAL